jgi:hypothetical protein
VVAEVAYGSLPFAEQIAFFRRKLNLPTNTWTDIWQEAHDHAFVVAGANRMDLVEDFRAAIDSAIADGTTLAQFRKDFDAIVAKHGWSYNGGRNWRSRVIYETNLRSSYAAGRYAQLQALKKTMPFWRYRHSDAVMHPRPLHLAWNGLVLHADDPWWQKHFPPNGWGCQCTVEALDELDLADLGKDGPDTAPPEDMQAVTVGITGPSPRTIETPAGVDPGFGYTPGADAWTRQQAQRGVGTDEAQAAAASPPLPDTTAEDLGRPASVPFAPAPVPLDEPQKAPEQVVTVLRELLGADSRVFDVRGLPVAVDAEALGAVIAPADAEYLPLLLDAVADPFEVWTMLEQAADAESYRVRGSIIKGYTLPGGDRIIVVIDQQDGSVIGWTLAAGSDAEVVNARRRGLLWWGAAGEGKP